MSFDNTRLTEGPTLYPSMEDFSSPIEYMSRSDVKKLGYEFGIVKIVPPQGWRPNFSLSTEFKFHTRLQKLSDLGITTRSRKFFLENINRYLKMKKRPSLPLYFVDNQQKVYYYDLFIEVDKAGGFNNITLGDWCDINRKFGIDSTSESLRLEYFNNIKSYAEFLNNNTNDFPDSDSEDEYGNCLICGKHNSPTKTLLCDNCDNPYHLKCLNMDEVPSGTWYCKKCLIGTGEYGFEEQVDIKYTLSEFFERCKKFEGEFVAKYGDASLDMIEKKFWEFVELQNNDIEVKYGADIHNLKPGQISGFPMVNTPSEVKLKHNSDEFNYYLNHSFNLTNLPYSKGSLLNYINHSISGMTIPWIYIGSLLSTFCWHVEDHYTLSANYCHFGSTKKWYGIPSSNADKFETLMRKSAPDLFKKQPDLLHQLVTLISPMKLADNNIKCVYVNQNPNEFVVTYPRVYHAGFNSGFNFNEAVNFAMDNWLEFGENSIYDYKKIKKENVFNHYELLENILKAYLMNEEMNLSLVKRSLISFENCIRKNRELSDKLDPVSIEFKTKDYAPRDFEREKQGYEDTAVKKEEEEEENEEEEEDDDEEEEDLCDICKTHLSYQYCIVNNKNHDFQGIQEPVEPKRISINQLLTPESSPLEQQQEKFTPPSIKVLESADNLSKVTESNKLRKSSRIDKLIHDKKPKVQTSKMSMINNKLTLNDLNAKREIKLCLECINKTQSENYIMIYEKQFDQLREFINSVKTKLGELE